VKPAHVHARHARAGRDGSRGAALGSLQPFSLDWPGAPEPGTGDRGRWIAGDGSRAMDRGPGTDVRGRWKLKRGTK